MLAIKTKIEKEGSRSQVIRLAFYENGTRSKFCGAMAAVETYTAGKFKWGVGLSCEAEISLEKYVLFLLVCVC